MGTFLLGVFAVLGPSMAAVAWLIWYSDAFKSSTARGLDKRKRSTIS